MVLERLHHAAARHATASQRGARLQKAGCSLLLTLRRCQEAAPLLPTAGTLLHGAAEGSPVGEDMASISLTAEGDAVEEVGTPSQSGAKEASLLEAVGGMAMSLFAPQCPCPLPVSSSLVRSIYASDAWEEEEEEEERLASGGAAAAGEPPSFERIMRASGGHICLEALDVLSTAAAQAAIRTRACMSEADRGGYDAMLEGVREALRTRGDQAELPVMHAAPLPPPSASSPGAHAEQPKACDALTPLLSEAASCAASLVSGCAHSFAAELAAAEVEGAGACSVPTVARAEDSQRWQGCEGVVALALERLHSRGLRRLGEAASRVLSQLQSMAASLAAGEATWPASGGLPWPASTLNKAHLVAACIACVEADTQRLLELFAAALARVVGLLDDAGLVEPAARVRSKAKAHHARLLSAQAAADALRAQAARLMIYQLAATHVATAV